MYTVHLRNNGTGEVRPVLETGPFDPESTPWMWSEGNFGCDCNLELFFARAGGESDPVAPACGDRKRFSVLKFVLEDGREVPVQVFQGVR